MQEDSRPTKRKRANDKDSTSAPETRLKRRKPLAGAGKRKRSFAEEGEEEVRTKGHANNGEALTAQSLRNVPREGIEERVCRWEGRDPSRLRIMSSTGNASNPRKRSRKSISTVTSQSSPPTSVPSERTSTYNKFASDVFMDNNIYGSSYRKDPSNKQALLSALDRTRRSLSPSVYPDSKFDHFVRANHEALNESQLVTEVIHPYFTSYFNHKASTDLAFSNLEPIVPPPPSMPPPKPDHSFGVAKEDINPTVRHALDRYIVCAPGSHTPAAVNDMMQVKGPDGKASVLESQITLDGAVGERAMHKLRSFAQGSTCPADGVSRAFVQSYHAGTMKFYAAHRQPSAANGPDRVYTTEIAGQYLCGSPSQLRDGIQKYRNSVELATQYRRQAVNEANARTTKSALDNGDSDDEDSDEFFDVTD